MYSIEMIDPLPDERFLQQNNHKNYFELLQTLFDSGYSSGVTNLFETPQYLLVTFRKTKDSPSIQDYTLIWDKQKKRGTYYYRYFDDNLLTLSTCLNLNSPSTCYSENTFITAISPLTFGTNMHVILEKDIQVIFYHGKIRHTVSDLIGCDRLHGVQFQYLLVFRFGVFDHGLRDPVV